MICSNKIMLDKAPTCEGNAPLPRAKARWSHGPAVRANGRPLVSVIIPAFNRQRFLVDSIESVLSQTYRNFEIIVVDDGSTDDVESFVRLISRDIRYFRQPHSGVAAARNRGVAEARGQLIAFQDSDDLWHPEKLDMQVALLEREKNSGMVCSAKRAINEDGLVVGGQWKPLYAGRITERLFEVMFVTMPSVVVRREVLEKVGPFDVNLRINSDYQYWLRASMVTDFSVIEKPLIDIRHSSDSLTRSSTEKRLIEFEMLERFCAKYAHENTLRKHVKQRRLAKAAFNAGRELFRDSNFAAAACMFKKSLSYRFSLRTTFSLYSSLISATATKKQGQTPFPQYTPQPTIGISPAKTGPTNSKRKTAA